MQAITLAFCGAVLIVAISFTPGAVAPENYVWCLAQNVPEIGSCEPPICIYTDRTPPVDTCPGGLGLGPP